MADHQPHSPALPERVRRSVISLASDVLGSLAAEEIPSALRSAARFAPVKRARLAAAALAATLESDPAFRAKVARAAEAAALPLSESLRAGDVPAAADPVQVGALAFLTRPPGWALIVGRVSEELATATEQARGQAADRQRQELQTQLGEARRELRAQAERARVEVAAARSELATTRQQVRELTGRLRSQESAAGAARVEADRLRRDVGRAGSAAQTEVRRLQQRLAEAEQVAEAARRAAREARGADDTRLWLLLESLTGAAQGLRRELALGTPDQRPGDAVAGAVLAASAGPSVSADLRTDDPALLDRLLSLPLAHLVIDGYNVTKTGYGELPLERQRARLTGGLGALTAQTGAEITCVFDGADRPPLMPPSPRGVRVLFSARGQTADDLIRRFVAAEPSGRTVVVVSSDREVADGARHSGAYPVPSVALLRRLERG